MADVILATILILALFGLLALLTWLHPKRNPKYKTVHAILCVVSALIGIAAIVGMIIPATKTTGSGWQVPAANDADE